MLRKTLKFAPISLFAALCAGAVTTAAQTANYGGVVTTLETGLNVVQGVAVDASGNVYIAADYQSSIEELVAANGRIPANPKIVKLGSGMSDARGVAVDKSGNVFVADLGDHTVKEILAVNGAIPPDPTIRTLGSGFSAPHGISVDGSGNVYVIDSSQNTVTEILAVNGTIPTSPTMVAIGSGFRGGYGVAVDASANVYIADTGNSAVKEVEVNTTLVSLGSGFSHPQSVAVDASGNVFVADTNNRAVKEIAANDSSQVLTIGSGFSSPKGVAVDKFGTIYVADSGTETIREINLKPGIFGSIALGATATATLTFNFTSPGSIMAPGVFTQGATGLDFIDAGTGTCTTLGTSHSYNAGDSCTVVVTFKPTYPGTRYGAVTLSDNSGTVIATANITGTGDGPQVIWRPGTNTTVGNINAHKHLYPTSVALDGSGNVYFVDSNTTLYEILADHGQISSNPTMRTLDFFASVTSVAIDGSGNLYVAAIGIIAEIVAVNGSIPTNPKLVFLTNGPNDAAVAVDGAGNVYFMNGGALQEIVAVNGTIPPVPATPTPVTLATGFSGMGLAVHGNGNVYVADPPDHQVKEIVAVNGQIPPNPTILSLGGFQTPFDVKVDGIGNVFVADEGADAVYEMAAVNGSVPASPSILTLADSSSGIITPWGVAVDWSGNVYVADFAISHPPAVGQVYKLDFADAPRLTFLPTTPGQTSNDSPQTVTIVNDGNENLIFSLPLQGTNPSISNQFTLNTGSTCQELTTSSAVPATLAPGSSCAELVSFVPVRTGSIPGSLTFTDNASPATQTVVLNGNVAPTLLAPVITPAPGTYNTALTVTMADSAPIYYTTDGSGPTVNSAVYTGPITVSVSETVKAIAIEPGFKSSPVTTYTYHLVPATPVFSPAPGIYGPSPFTVALTDTTLGVTFYYTTDGSLPTTASTLYTGSITVASTEFLRAIATETGYSNSAAGSAKYTYTSPTPVISPNGQDFKGSITVTITDASPLAKIYYTFAGNTPEVTSTPYTGPFTVSRSEVIRAIASVPGEAKSAIAGQVYTLTK
jgi:sugar lactone lactonase YvrE